MSFLVSTSHNSISHKHGACFSLFTGNPFLWVSLLIFLHSCLELLPMDSNTPLPEGQRFLRLRKLGKLPRSKRFGKLEDPQGQVMRFLKHCIYLGGACITAHEQRSEDSLKGLVLSFHPTIRVSRIQFWSSGLEAHPLPPGPSH